MAGAQNDGLATLKEFNGKLALELVFAEPGKDNGLLPVNYLLSQIEEQSAGMTLPVAVQQALKLARQWIDGILNSNALFSEQSLKQLGVWTHWMESALDALGNESELPVQPEEWQTTVASPLAAAASISATPASVAEPNAEDEIPLNIDLSQDAELLREFISEAYEHLQNIELGVLVLEEKPEDSDTLNSIFRAFHTFKGGSALLNLKPLNRLAHELESLLDLARQHRLRISSPIINLILESGDVLKQFTVEIERQLLGEKPVATILIPIQGLIARARSDIRVTTGGKPAVVLSFPNAPQANAEPKALPVAAKATPATDRSQSAAPAQTETASTSGATGNKAGINAMVVKVATQKLDSLVDLAGELVISQSQVAQDAALKNLANERLERNLAQLGRITNELQKIVMSLRMVPLRSTFQKMNRLVRDLGAKQGKQAELQLAGEDTELDRTIAEQLNDPLVHMIRNAVDHGLEKPEVRLARGKPAQGTIRLSAFHQGGNIVIEIRDDGAGLNRERIRAKAIEKGLAKADDDLSEDEIFHLIFAPGFSTAEVITDVSGRGVGMDVVRRNIEKLRGKIQIQSRPGEGSTFTIYLPLTLAIIDGLMVAVGEERFILPSLMVRESFRPLPGMVSTVYGRGEMVNVRGRLSPVLRLYDFFGLRPHSEDPTQSVMVLVGNEFENRCLMVDQLLGKQEVVIKSLGETFKQNRALAGAAILGDGRVGLILDVDYLIKLKADSLKKAA